jgi:hypothetical protein
LRSAVNGRPPEQRLARLRALFTPAGDDLEDVCGPSLEGLTLLLKIGGPVVGPGNPALMPALMIYYCFDDVRLGDAELG